MKKTTPAANPDAYVAALTGWRRKCVESLRRAVRTTPGLEEEVKWGHLVYLANGPVLLIRAEDARVLFGFWRGRRLTEIEPRLKRSGKYEMATIELREGDTVKPAMAKRLAKEATAFNKKLGDPRDAAKHEPQKTASTKKSPTMKSRTSKTTAKVVKKKQTAARSSAAVKRKKLG
ncbi:MAG: DUF1801 domain-containing protein [Phycisphaerales bacterium]|nr:DUF1801 domain-containing protein [Phycisphaerales bacterium]